MEMITGGAWTGSGICSGIAVGFLRCFLRWAKRLASGRSIETRRRGQNQVTLLLSRPPETSRPVGRRRARHRRRLLGQSPMAAERARD
ncbi:hypothetical protein E2562_023724 [Oryza meyeriana var. granulata]|uniref:Uncharacterized protein n=1 Tax=Oryza meyeriana var. granulata TaxID=110450 RepID=A0A6G1DNE8_9ORYZ|nr:hypothetical protein E2562_023724 [Oryza meyeriana var. granulata]